jgi:hypothetical protein
MVENCTYNTTALLLWGSGLLLAVSIFEYVIFRIEKFNAKDDNE